MQIQCYIVLSLSSWTWPLRVTCILKHFTRAFHLNTVVLELSPIMEHCMHLVVQKRNFRNGLCSKYQLMYCTMLRDAILFFLCLFPQFAGISYATEDIYQETRHPIEHVGLGSKELSSQEEVCVDFCQLCSVKGCWRVFQIFCTNLSRQIPVCSNLCQVSSG